MRVDLAFTVALAAALTTAGTVMATGGGPPLRSDVDVAAAREAIRVEFETLKGEMHKMSARDATVSARPLRLEFLVVPSSTDA
jgi:hypothetical protein